MQHSHNIILEIAFNYGLPSSLLIVGGMLFILFKGYSSFKFNKREGILKTKNNLSDFNKAWITSFIVFIFLHMFDITYFDGRISLISWIILSGIRNIIEENKEKNFNLEGY